MWVVEILKLVGNLEQKKPLKRKKSFSSIYENLNWWLRGLDSISTRSPGPHGKNFKQTIFPCFGESSWNEYYYYIKCKLDCLCLYVQSNRNRQKVSFFWTTLAQSVWYSFVVCLSLFCKHVKRVGFYPFLSVIAFPQWCDCWSLIFFWNRNIKVSFPQQQC